MKQRNTLTLILLLAALTLAAQSNYSPCYTNNMSKGNTAFSQGKYSEARTYYANAKQCAGGNPTAAQQKINACDAKIKAQREVAEAKRKAEQEAAEAKRKAEAEAAEAKRKAEAEAKQKTEAKAQKNQHKSPPKIQFDQITYDFGEIKEENGKVTARFTFTNVGGEDLMLVSVRPGCGCTAANYTKTAIAPGEKGYIDATFNPANRSGSFNKNIRIITNEPEMQVENPRPHLIFIKGSIVPKQ